MTDNQPASNGDFREIEDFLNEGNHSHCDSCAKLPFVPPEIQGVVIEEGLPEDVIAEWSVQQVRPSRTIGDESA